MATANEMKLMEIFAKGKVIPTLTIEDTKDVKLLRLMQTYIEHRRDFAGFSGVPPTGWATEYLTLALKLHELEEKKPFSHIPTHRINFDTSDYDGLSQDLARALAKHVRRNIEDFFVIPEFYTQEEIFNFVKYSTKDCYTLKRLPLALNTYLSRFGATDEIQPFIAEYQDKINAPNLRTILTHTANEKLIMAALNEEIYRESAMVNPHLTEAIFLQAMHAETPYHVEKVLKNFKKSETMGTLVKELRKAKPVVLKGEASEDLIDGLKKEKAYAVRYNRSGWTYGNPKPQVDLSAARIDAHEKNFKNLKKRLERAQDNAAKGKVTQAYVTKLQGKLTNAERYQKGLGILKAIEETQAARATDKF